MTLKSNIDWNEIIPLLPRQKREELYLEAVTLLSQDDRENEVLTRKRHKSRSKKQVLRKWKEQGIEGPLGEPGRKYKINKESKIKVFGGVAKLWEVVKASHNDVITYEGLASIAKGQEYRSVGDAIWNLWSRKLIDIAP